MNIEEIIDNLKCATSRDYGGKSFIQVTGNEIDYETSFDSDRALVCFCFSVRANKNWSISYARQANAAVSLLTGDMGINLKFHDSWWGD